MIDMTPVDYVSQGIVHLSRQKEALGQNFHLVNPQPLAWHEFVNWVRTFGYPLRQLTYDKWQLEAFDSATHDRDNTLHQLVPLLTEKIGMAQMSDRVLSVLTSGVRFDSMNTIDLLADTSIVCPPVDAELLSVYFSYFIRSGLLDTPQPMGMPT
jgi:hypothetical protein